MPGRKLELFRKNRCGSPSFEIPKLCLSRQSRTVSIDVEEQTSTTSLSVPLEQRGRSSSFDTSSLQNEKNVKLQVPLPGRRCHSFDSTTSIGNSWLGSSDENISDKEGSTKASSGSLKIPKSRSRRRSSLEIPKLCIHCVHMESYYENEKQKNESFDSEGCESEELWDDSSFSDSDDSGTDLDIYLSDSDASSDVCNEFDDNENSVVCKANMSKKQPSDKTNDFLFTNAVTLAVPVIKQQRSSSFDGGLLRKTTNTDGSKGSEGAGRGTLQRQKSFEDTLDVKNQVRSTSVDVNLPTEETSHYKAITGSPGRQ